MSTMQKWQNASAGKIQCNRFNKAWNALNWEHNTVTQLTGVIGKSERSCTISHLCGTGEKRADVTAAQEAIGQRFAWTVTAQNVNEIIKAIEEATAAAVQNRPVEDNRETSEAVAERTTEYARLEAERTSGFELPAELQNLRDSYRGGGVTHAHWEITFTQAYRDAITLDAIQGYGTQQPTGTGGGPAPKVEAVTISENEEKNGIEIRFPSKPDAAVLESLKENGWRWSRFSQCWYTRRSEQARQFAESLNGGQTIQTQTTQTTTAAATEAAPKGVAAPGKAIPDDVLDVLRTAADFDSDSVKLTAQLDRDLYLKVNKTLEQAGGKWNRGRQCHVFAQNPRDLLKIDEGHIDHTNVTAATIEHALKNGTQAVMVSNLFPTPADLARRVATEAGIEPEHRVMDPEAGTGALLRAVDEVAGCAVDKVAIEISAALVDILVRSGFSGLHVHQGDFLEQNGNLGKFDRIVMNPPFENGADIKHIKHALGFLKPGGRLVAICANGSRQQEQLKPLAEASGGWWEDLPAGTFKEQGTGVSTALLVIEKAE